VWAPDSRALAPLVDAAVGNGDAVLVKGSRGARMEVVVARLKGGSPSSPAGNVH
jgi:UDP-N-acetylmuramyl pentapeptide synthase